MKRYSALPLIYCILAFFLLISCKKEGFITAGNASISVSTDSLLFDTVFTSTGTITQFVKIFNDNGQKLRFDDITLSGGKNSAFKINIDGVAESSLKNIELDANDSLYIFVTVTINPDNNKLPFIVSDSIRIRFNGNEKLIQLQAWGQNAHFFRNEIISGNQIWKNDLPYVIMKGVRVDTTASLTIEKGCRIYLHADAPFIIDGTLKVNGTKTDSVVFRGDRLDEAYKNIPASWPGIIFRGKSKQNVLTHTNILNAYRAIIVSDPAPDGLTKLKLESCIIDNALDAGIIATNSSVNAINCLVTNCGANITLNFGGNYSFIHCTVAGYGNRLIAHKTPVLRISNLSRESGPILTKPLTADFTNCIFWGEQGSVDDEVTTEKEGADPYQVRFEHCLYKVLRDPLNASFVGSVKNMLPDFDTINTSVRLYNFRLKSGSPGINMGVLTGIVFDLDGNNRAVGLPDAGCYETQ